MKCDYCKQGNLYFYDLSNFCKHKICRVCFEKYFITQCWVNGIFPSKITCPIFDCPVILQKTETYSILLKNAFYRYLFKCKTCPIQQFPMKKCKYCFQISIHEKFSVSFYCNRCNSSFCTYCLENEHEECPQLQKRNQDFKERNNETKGQCLYCPLCCTLSETPCKFPISKKFNKHFCKTCRIIFCDFCYAITKNKRSECEIIFHEIQQMEMNNEWKFNMEQLVKKAMFSRSSDIQ